jgi:hypothetical protein
MQFGGSVPLQSDSANLYEAIKDSYNRASSSADLINPDKDTGAFADLVVQSILPDGGVWRCGACLIC